MFTEERMEVLLNMALDTISSRETTIRALLEKIKQLEAQIPKESEVKIHKFNEGVATRPL